MVCYALGNAIVHESTINEGFLHIECKCPRCSKVTVVHDVARAALEELQDSRADRRCIQHVLPDHSVVEREALMTGYCSDCWTIVNGAL